MGNPVDLTYQGRNVGYASGSVIGLTGVPQNLKNIDIPITITGLNIANIIQGGHEGTVPSSLSLSVNVSDNNGNSIIKNQLIPLSSLGPQLPQTTNSGSVVAVLPADRLGTAGPNTLTTSTLNDARTGYSSTNNQSAAYEEYDAIGFHSEYLPKSGMPFEIDMPHGYDAVRINDKQWLDVTDANKQEIADALAETIRDSILSSYTSNRNIFSVTSGYNALTDSTGKYTLYQGSEMTYPVSTLTDADFSIKAQVLPDQNGIDRFIFTINKKNNKQWYFVSNGLKPVVNKNNITNSDNQIADDKDTGELATKVPLPTRINFTAADYNSPGNLIGITNTLSSLEKIYTPAQAQQILNEINKITYKYNGNTVSVKPNSVGLAAIQYNNVQPISGEVGQLGRGSVELVDDKSGQVYASAPFSGTVGNTVSFDSASLNQAVTNDKLIIDDGYIIPSTVTITSTSMKPIQILVHKLTVASYNGTVGGYDDTSHTDLGKAYTLSSGDAKAAYSLASNSQTAVSAWQGYLTKFEQANSNINFGNYVFEKVLATPSASGTNYTVKLQFLFTHKTANSTETRTVIRHITINPPTGSSIKQDQTATFTRINTKDLVTGNTTSGNWDKPNAQLPAYRVPAYTGYTASGTVSMLTVTPDSKDSSVVINYTPNEATENIIYEDPQKNPIHKTVVGGKVGQTINVPSEVPDGWHIVSGKVPSNVTLKPTNPDVVIIIDHNHITVTPDNPQQPGTRIPGTKTKTFPKGVQKDDLNSTVTRTIIINTPDGKSSTQVQTVTFTRSADVDEVTGKVTYNPWSENGQHTFEEVDAPVIQGYEPTGNAPQVVVHPGNKDTTVTIGYKANDSSQKVIYQDNGGNIINTTVTSGKVGSSVDIPSGVPDGWEIIKGSLPSKVTLKEINPDIVITIGHIHVEVPHDKPVNPGSIIPGTKAKTFPKGLTDTDLNKSLTRTIILRMPGQKDEDVVQVIKVWRDADVDAVTGQIVYTKWHAEKDEFPLYNVPAKDGFEPDMRQVMPEEIDVNVPNITVVVNYHKLPTQVGSQNTSIPAVSQASINVPSEAPYFNWPHTDTTTFTLTLENNSHVAKPANNYNGSSFEHKSYSSGKHSGNYSNAGNNNAGNNRSTAFNGNNSPSSYANKLAVPALIATGQGHAIGNAANTGNNIANSVQSHGNTNNNSILPQTGEKNNAGIIALGLAMVVLPLGLASDRKRQ